MSSNKLAGVGAAVTALVGALITLLGAVPEKWQGPVVMTALFCITILAAVYMLGSQKWDKLVMDSPFNDSDDEDVEVNVNVEPDEDGEPFPGDIEAHPDFDNEGHEDIDEFALSPDVARPEGNV